MRQGGAGTKERRRRPGCALLRGDESMLVRIQVARVFPPSARPGR